MYYTKNINNARHIQKKTASSSGQMNWHTLTSGQVKDALQMSGSFVQLFGKLHDRC